MERLTKIVYAVSLIFTALMLACATFACLYILYREFT